MVCIDFKNGIRLNLKKTDFKADEIIVKAAFCSGRSDEPEALPGLALLSKDVINESGLGRYDRDEIERAFAGKNTSVYFDINEDSFFFKGTSVSDELTLLFQLLYAHITDPGYRKDAYDLSMQRFKQKYISLSHSIDGSIALYGKRFLAGGDTRFGFPPYEVFKRLTLDDVQSWIKSNLENALFEISVVGDFDMELAENAAAKYFGSLPRRVFSEKNKQDDALVKKRIPIFPAGQSRELFVKTKIPKGLVVTAFASSDLWDIHLTRRFSTLADVFSERLRKRIREKLGASYSPFAYNNPSSSYDGYGVLASFIHVKPGDARIVKDEVMKIVSDMNRKGINKDELKRAIDPAITGIKDMLRTNGYWLNTVLSGSREHPCRLEWSRTILKDYSSITTDELSKIAQVYLAKKKAAVIIIRPEESKPEKN